MSSEIPNHGKKLEVVDESMNESRNLSINQRETLTKNSIVTPTVKTFAEDSKKNTIQASPSKVSPPDSLDPFARTAKFRD